MKPLISRRNFLQLSGRGILAGAALPLLAPQARAIEPLVRKGSPRLSLSLAAYSFRDSFATANRSNPPGGKSITLFDFIDFCADQGCQGTELTSYYFPQPVEKNYLLQLRRHAFLRGIAISGTAVGNNFTVKEGEERDKQIAAVKSWVDHAALMGAPHIRVFAGTADAAEKEAARKRCISALEECAAYAGQKGIFLGLENHGGIVAEPEDLLEIIRSIKSPWVGINLDTGNFHTDDPYRDVALCAPYAVNVQVKAELRKRGAKAEATDLPRLVKILRDANYQGYVALEYESAENPWVAVPRLLGELGKLLGVP